MKEVLVALAIVLAGAVGFVAGNAGDKTVVDLGAFPGTDVTQDMTFYESIKFKEPVVSIATTTSGGNYTLNARESGTSYYFSATGTTVTLPAVTNEGTNFRFVVGGALDTANLVIDSAEGDNIEGTLIVAGAVVDCDAEDQINFVIDGENIGDYVEVRSNGTNWLIGDSGVLTTAKMTCTDPS